MIDAPDRPRLARIPTILLVVPALTFALGGCAVVRLARGVPGVDLSSITAGVDRETVEIRLHEPIRDWETSQGVVYAWYLYDGGVTRNRLKAFGTALLDLCCLFMPELAYAMEDVDTKGALHSDQHFDLIAIAYDRNARVVALFPGAGEYSALPDDGRAVDAATPSR